MCANGQFHLQLLRLLLRGADRRPAFRTPAARQHHELYRAIETGACTGCGKCVDVCPVEAMGLVSASDPKAPRRKKARVDARTCLGCGVCVRSCPSRAITLARRERTVVTPVNTAHRVVLMAVERGNLQNLIFDNHALSSHRAMAAILGAVLALPPAKRSLAAGLLKSRYVAAALDRLCP